MENIGNTTIENELEHLSIEELEKLKEYMSNNGLHAYALDLQFAIADKVKKGISEGSIETYNESNTEDTLAEVREQIQKKYGHNSRS
ncbi:MAG: hypothetical protein NE328_11645 [Lentisphaeraceae bacterium]|nr:hypothetical protein [Lentisphaeraceae bacterium]